MAYFATSRHGSFAGKWINVAGLSKTHFYEKYLMQMKGQNMCTMAGETGGGGGGREGPSPPASGPHQFHFLGGTRGDQYITKMGPFYLSWTVFQQFQ